MSKNNEPSPVVVDEASYPQANVHYTTAVQLAWFQNEITSDNANLLMQIVALSANADRCCRVGIRRLAWVSQMLPLRTIHYRVNWLERAGWLTSEWYVVGIINCRRLHPNFERIHEDNKPQRPSFLGYTRALIYACRMQEMSSYDVNMLLAIASLTDSDGYCWTTAADLAKMQGFSVVMAELVIAALIDGEWVFAEMGRSSWGLTRVLTPNKSKIEADVPPFSKRT